MAERTPNLPEWTFRGGELVTVNPIRREKLRDDWVGDESNGILAEELKSNGDESDYESELRIINTEDMTVEEMLETF